MAIAASGAFARAARRTLAASLAIASAAVQAHADPRVPAGVHPGGVPVALIGEGIDYTAPDIHPRLARDGEGELTGFDFSDDDRQPFNAPGDTAAARAILNESSAAALVVVRTDFSRPEIFAAALRFAVTGPARIIVVCGAFQGADFMAFVRAAADRFPKDLFLVEAGDGGRDLDRSIPADAQGPGNVLIVTAARADGTLADGANAGRSTVDIAIALPDRLPDAPAAPALPATRFAVARLAALASRLVAASPQLSGDLLKARVTGLAHPWAVAYPATRYGWISGPDSHVQGK